MTFKVTLNRIRAHSPCEPGWVKLLQHLGKTQADDKPLSLLTVLESNGLYDALWCLRAVKEHEKEIRRFACQCALDVIHLWDAPPIVKKYLKTGNEKLRAAAMDAAWAAAGDAAWAGAWAAAGAGAAARDAARAAARDAARDAAGDAARDAAWAAMREKQTARFKRMVKK